MTASSADRFVEALLSCLLPGDGRWPGARETRAPGWFTDRMGQSPELAAAVGWLRSTVPADVGMSDVEWLADHLRACEASEPARFALVVAEAVSGYYTDASVLRLIERTTGFPARPPQPAGHTLEPFDWSVLDGRRRRD